MMTSRERVYATLDFQGPDRLATDIWALPSTFTGREAAVRALMARHPADIAGVWAENVFAVPIYPRGVSVDEWGCEWLTLLDGMVGEVKRAPLADYATLSTYAWPEQPFGPRWQAAADELASKRDCFTSGFVGNPFERMQFLRGPADLYADLADEDCDEIYRLRDKVFAMLRVNMERWCALPVDAVSLNDDWGSQRSLLISPAKWRAFFKPKYREVLDIARDAGKRIFFHSDGYIADIFPDLIELGVDALNSQVWCMGLDTIAPFAGQITFWGELDRQHLLPHGTPQDIRDAARRMYHACYRNGGLIGQCEFDHLTTLDNIEAALSCWGEIALGQG